VRLCFSDPQFVHRVIHICQELFTAGAAWGSHFATVFRPIAGETDLIGKNPDAALTLKNVDQFSSVQEELRLLIAPELELIESRIIAPLKELRDVLKSIRKTVTKRDHKVCYVDGPATRSLISHFDITYMHRNQQLTDYDRFNNSLTKLREKKEKSLNDEKNLFRVGFLYFCSVLFMMLARSVAGTRLRNCYE
jgi:amphiphysin